MRTTRTDQAEGELAAQHSKALGVPAERHIEVRRSREVDGERVPFDLLTFIAERGDWPWLGRAPTCTGPWKARRVYQAFTPQVRALRKGTDGPLMFANVLGMRAEESPDRRNREALRRTTDNSARVVDEWLPAQLVSICRPHGTPRPVPSRASSCTAPLGAMAAADHRSGTHPSGRDTR